MRLFYLYKCYVFLFCLVLFGSCTERIHIHTGKMQDAVVILGTLSTDTCYQKISVALTAPYFSADSNKTIENAMVTITSLDDSVWILSPCGKGEYVTTEKLIPQEGKTYFLKVRCDDKNNGELTSFTAQTTIPIATPLDSIRYVPDKMMFDIYKALIYTEIPESERYCLYKFYDNGKPMTPKLSDYLLEDIKLWNKNGYIDGLSCNVFFDKKDYDKYDTDQQKNLLFIGEGDTVTIALTMIDKGYYDFIRQCQSEQNGENPAFGGPAANIITNISNGGYGYFGATNFVKKSNIVSSR